MVLGQLRGPSLGDGHPSGCPNQRTLSLGTGLGVCDGAHRGFVMNKIRRQIAEVGRPRHSRPRKPRSLVTSPWDNEGVVAETSRWVDISTVVAATAGLWALAFAWVTYVMSVRQQDEDEFQALKSIVVGLGVELKLIKDWTATGGEGYSKAMTSPPDWSQPNRFIWKFD